MNNTDQNSLLGRLLSSHGAVVALFAALLYLAGMTTLTVRMAKAGLNAQDTLPLFSLDQLLRIGLTWIYPAVPALVVLAVLYFASVYFERKLSLRAERFETERAETVDALQRDSWKQSFAAMRESTDWLGVEAGVRKAIEEREGHPKVVHWESFRKRLTGFNVWTLLIYFLLTAACFLLAVPFGIATLIVLIVTWVRLGTRPARQMLFPLYAVVAIGFLSSAIFNPRPLPWATIVTTAPAEREVEPEKEGDLIVISDATWYLGDSDDEILAIPSARIESSSVQSRASADTLAEMLWSQIKKVGD